MSKITRRVTKTESLKLKPCPLCGGEVTAADCGYSSFNPGSASCNGCKKKWDLGWVDDEWDAGKLWNKLQPQAARIEELQKELASLRKKSGLDDED